MGWRTISSFQRDSRALSLDSALIVPGLKSVRITDQFELGAVLVQNINDVENIANRALSDAKKIYSVTEHYLAVVWAIQKFRSYLEGYRFTMLDHSSCIGFTIWEILPVDWQDGPSSFQNTTMKSCERGLATRQLRLSRMFEGLRDAEIQLEMHNCRRVFNCWGEGINFWRHRGPVISSSQSLRKIVDSQLYHLKPCAVTSAVVNDLDYWKLVLPCELRGEASQRETHDASEHLLRRTLSLDVRVLLI